MPHTLNGLRVVSFESRRAAEMAELIRNYGGEPIQAPFMRAVPLTDQREALAFGKTLLAGDWDALILLTGVGTRMFIAACATRWPKDEVVKALGRLTLVCRGPKPIAALKEVGLAPALGVPEPNTWRDLLSELDRKLPVAGKRVAVQEYGARNEELLAGPRLAAEERVEELGAHRVDQRHLVASPRPGPGQAGRVSTALCLGGRSGGGGAGVGGRERRFRQLGLSTAFYARRWLGCAGCRPSLRSVHAVDGRRRERAPPVTAPARPRVVIVGGGFGGLACARKLDHGPVDVLLVDGHNYHLFTPLLYQVATALLNPSDIVYPFRTIFRRSPNVRFRQAFVTGVDFNARVVSTRDGERIPYDHLVLASGSTNNYYGNPELSRFTIGMKTIPEALRLRNHVLTCLELAAREPAMEDKRHWLTFVVAGGGPTGVEYSGALAELLKLVLGRDFPELSPSLARIVLVEGNERLLHFFSPELGAYAKRILTDRGIEVQTSTLLKRTVESSVTLSTGEVIKAGTVVWSAGVRPTEPTGNEGLSRSRTHRLEVDEHLRLKEVEDVYAIGDVASFRQGDAELPMLSPPAMQGGRFVARAILAAARGESVRLQPFHYVDKGAMATIGRNAAVAQTGSLRLSGFIGWLTWLIVHIYYLIGFRNRLAVLASWAWNYIRKDRSIRIIARSEGDPLTEEMETGRGTPPRATIGKSN